MATLFAVVKAAALAAYAVLFLVTLRSPAEPRTKRYFLLFLAGMMVWQLTSLLAGLEARQERALLWYNLLVAGSGFFNIMFFPFTRALLGIERQKGLTVAAYVAGLSVTISAVLGLQFREVVVGRGGYYVPIFGDPALYAMGAVAYFYWGCGVVNLFRGLRLENSAFQKNRIRYVLLGAVIIFAGAASNFTPLRDYPVDIACNLVAAGVVAYAVFRHRLLDIRVVLVRSLFYSILTGLLVLLYLLGLVGLQRLLERSLRPSSPGYGVLAILVAAAVFLPVRNLLQRGLDRLFFRQRYDYQKVMEEFSRSVASVHDPSRLLDLVVAVVRETVRVEKLLVTLWSEEASCYTVERVDGMAAAVLPDCAFRESHPMARWLGREGVPLLREELRTRPELAPLREESQELFERTDTFLVVPILSKSRLTGTIHVGRKLAGTIFNEEDLRFFTTVANQAATALDNAFVYREIERRLAEQTLLFVLSETFRRRIGFEMVLQSATEVLRDFLNVDYCLLCALRSGRASVYAAGGVSEAVRPAFERALEAYLAADGGPASAEGLDTLDMGRVLWRAGGAAEADLRVVEAHECYPLRQTGDLLGLLVFPAGAGVGRPQDRRDLLRAVCSILSQGVMVNRSLSDLQEMKNYNDDIINSMASCVVVVDSEMRVTTVNQAAREFASLDGEAAGGAVGRPLGEVEVLGQIAGIVGEALSQGRTCRNRETQVQVRDGRTVPVSLSTSVLSTGGGQRGVVAIFSDLTELKELEKQLLRSEKLASVGRLAAGISHELRNPLGSIAGYAELLQERVRTDDEVVKRGLATIVGESERSRKIIDSLLDYARIKEPHFDVVEVSRVIDDTVPLVERELTKRRIRIERDYRDGGARVRADREQMREVLINLLLNAGQATEGDGKSITLSTRLEGERVLVSVADQGCGIPPESMNKLFDPFFTTKADGTGLGLSIVHRIVDAHQGLIWVDSAPGVGSTFTVGLPVAG